MLGFGEVRAAFVPHPISDASGEEMERKAEGSLPAVVQALTTAEPSALQGVQDVAASSSCDS